MKKLDFKECKKILNKKGQNYTDEQVQEVREFIDELAEIIVGNNLLPKMKKNYGLKWRRMKEKSTIYDGILMAITCIHTHNTMEKITREDW